MEVGKKFYIIAHAYWHVIACRRTRASQFQSCRMVRSFLHRWNFVIPGVYSSRKNWTEFFKKGIGTGDTYDIWPDGTTVSTSKVNMTEPS